MHKSNIMMQVTAENSDVSVHDYTHTNQSSPSCYALHKDKHVSMRGKVPLQEMIVDKINWLLKVLKFCMVFILMKIFFANIEGIRFGEGKILSSSVFSLSNFNTGVPEMTALAPKASTLDFPDEGRSFTSAALSTGISMNPNDQYRTEHPFRILYVMTSLTDTNNGERGTIRGEDRLQEVTIPTLVDGIKSMISPPYNFEVDVYLILGWQLIPERREIIENALPDGVGLEIWDNAVPYGYNKVVDEKIKKVIRSLSRQHRYVIKDKIDQYDFFISFEDDMRITGAHVEHFLGMSEELKILADQSPESLDEVPETKMELKQRFFGSMTKAQAKRLIPGFMRVEVLLDEDRWPSQSDLDPIPVDLQFAITGKDTKTVERKVDPKICCLSSYNNATKLPPTPDTDKIVTWESGSLGVVVRQLPKGANDLLDWVLLQPGPFGMPADEFIGGYWSGRDGAFGNETKPRPTTPYLFSQQAGWMATREQLIDINENHCSSGFLPPYENPTFVYDGLERHIVEFWSGGFQLFTGKSVACNMQRVISLHPDHFSYHLIYHTSNNKQKGEFPVKPERVVKVNNFYGQVNSVVKAAQRAMYSKPISNF